MLRDGVVYLLYEAGAIDSSKKAIDTGKIRIQHSLWVQRKLYDFLDHNEPDVYFLRLLTM